MANITEQIINWFNGPQDYDQGIALLQEVSRKNKVIHKLIRRGKTRDSVEKLIYELNKVVGLKKIPAPQPVKIKDKVKKIKESITNQSSNTDSEGEENQDLKYNLIGEKDIDSYPPEVNRLVKEYSSLYMERGKKHSALKKFGDGNGQDIIDARKLIIDEIKTISDRLEILNEAFRTYEDHGTAVDSEILWPEETQNVKTGAKVSTESIEELKTLKKNLQSSLTKDRNLLLYGSKTQPKNGKGKMMPAGPKRTILEKRVLKKEKEIAELDQRIADLT